MKKGEDNIIDSFNMVKTGSLASDIENIDLKLTSNIKSIEVPEIEVKEVVIKETGNFLKLKDNIINIPVEMIVFPFFTPQKQNKKVNFQYSFQDLGVTMSCTLIAKDAKDKVFQPSIFEEKIYTYLISMYELKKEVNNTDEYIEFEISDFIVNFLGNKMNRTYYTKVEQALKNMKNTEYQFIISNHSKLGKYKFEDEEFKLLTYKKLERGRKKYYRVTLNKNIRNKIKDKRYIKYNSRELLRILTKDAIAGRIYKYISKIRYDKISNTINLRTLAAIVPLKTEQITERKNKKGEVKEYVLSRLKQVLKRICKAFDMLIDMGYILEYSYDYSKEEDTYYVHYTFNQEKDGECHVSEYIGQKQDKTSIEYISKKINKEKYNDENIIEAQIIDEKIKNETKAKKIITKKVKDEVELPYKVQDAITKARKNFRINKAWDKRTETKIKKIYLEDGEERVLEVLKILYDVKTDIKTTLVQYINGVLKNITNNLTLFGNAVKGKGMKSKKSINRARKTKKITKEIKEEIKVNEEIIIPKQEINAFQEFEKLDEYEKLKIEEKAIMIYSKEKGADEKLLIMMKNQAEILYIDLLKPYIEQVILEMKDEEK